MTTKRNSADIKRSILIVLVLFLAIALWGMVIAFHGMTIDNLWITLGASTAIGLFSGFLFWQRWQRFTRISHFIPNYAISVIFMTAIIADLFYGLNFAFADKESTTESATIERLYSETHHHTKRVSRRTVVQGEPYKMYYVEVRFRTGKKKTMTMPLRQWSKMHRGDTLQIKISKGLLGMPVIRRSGCPVDVPRSSYSRQFYRH